MVKLVDIAALHKGILIDIRYASENNFTQTPVYRTDGCFLNQEANEKLIKSIELAKNIGLRLRIFDAFRPHEAQMALWNHTPDENFLSHPETGSMPHCRGVAIDLTLVDAEGNDLDMGTEFDAFTSLSHHGNTEISLQAQQNRFLLMGIMTAAGWDNYMNEWWHYQLFNCRDYPLLTDKESGTGMM